MVGHQFFFTWNLQGTTGWVHQATVFTTSMQCPAWGTASISPLTVSAALVRMSNWEGRTANCSTPFQHPSLQVRIKTLLCINR